MCIRYLYVSPECQDKTILLRLLAIVLGQPGKLVREEAMS